MSEWKERSIKRRDERNTKISDEVKKPSSKKNTKLWCKGKVGKGHTPKCMPYSKYPVLKDWRQLVCTTCGKILETYTGKLFGNEIKPDWVIEDE